MKLPLRVAVLFLMLVGSAQICTAGMIYTGDSSGQLWTTDSGTGSSTLIGSMGSTHFDIAFNPFGQLYGVSGGTSLYSINAGTAAVSFIGNLSNNVFVNGLDFSSDGVLFGSGNNTLYTINTVTGIATTVGTIGFTSGGDLAFASDGTLYMTTFNNRLVKVDKTSGSGTDIGAIGFSDVHGIDFIGNTLYGTTFTGQLLTINTATGAGDLVAATNPLVASYGSSVNPVAVPEPPTSLALCALAALGTTLGAVRRRRQDQAAA